jgi:hypothetical protein
VSNSAWLVIALIVIFAGIIGYAGTVFARTKAVARRLEERRSK